MLGDANRGFLLEHVLTKLRVADYHRHATTAPAPIRRWRAEKQEEQKEQQLQPASHHPSSSLPPLQIIALSATLPNIQHLCRCLDAGFYASSYRPVELAEKYVTQAPLGGDSSKLALFMHDGRVDGRKLPRYHPVIFPLLRQPGTPYHDPTMIGYLCYETVAAQKNAIVFCSSKTMCVRHAKRIAQVLQKLSSEQPADEAHLTRAAELLTKRHHLMNQLQNTATTLDPALKVGQLTTAANRILLDDRLSCLVCACRCGCVS
jgi:replicative superfamily II helicase